MTEQTTDKSIKKIAGVRFRENWKVYDFDSAGIDVAVGDNVIVGSGAKILGPFTVGDNAKVGSNSVVVKEVPPNATVVGVPGRVVMSEEERQERTDLEHGRLPDPEAKAISCLFDQIRALERKVRELTEEQERLRAQLSKPEEKLPEAIAQEAR